jgi:hypothetical protein
MGREEQMNDHGDPIREVFRNTLGMDVSNISFKAKSIASSKVKIYKTCKKKWKHLFNKNGNKWVYK